MTESGITAEIRDRLVELWLFADVPGEDLAQLLDAARVVSYRGGDVIFREGDAADGLYVVAAGTIRIAAASLRGGPVLLTTVEVGEVFGEIGVIYGQSRSGSAIAATSCTCYFLPSEPFLSALARTSALSRHLIILFTERLRSLNRRLADLPLGVGPPAPTS